MKTITFKELKEKILNNFETEQLFVSWWLEERNKYISNSYPNKPIMKLMVDQHNVLPTLKKILDLKSDMIIETSEYPVPPINIEYYIRNYHLFFVFDSVENVMDEIIEDVTEVEEYIDWDKVEEEVKVKKNLKKIYKKSPKKSPKKSK